MTSDEFEQLKNWFYDYTGKFISDVSDPAPYMLKREHTLRVCNNIDMLSGSLRLEETERVLARTAALVHDIGRFTQFKVYGTFSDPLSKNHAALGVGVLTKQKFPFPLPAVEKRLILKTIALHNRPYLPSTLSPDLLQLARMLRDADKIDIYKVMTDLYRNHHNTAQNYITHNLPDDKQVPPELVEQIIAGNAVHYNQVNSLNGIKLFQLSMIFDLNFPTAFESIQKQDVVGAILGSMPTFPRLEDLEQGMTKYISDRIKKTALLTSHATS